MAGLIENIITVKKVLEQIVELFADAEGISRKFKSREKIDSSDHIVLNGHTDMDPLG